MKAVLGVTGGVSAYKSAVLARLMVKEGWEVKTVMTESACRFIAPLSFQALTSGRVYTDMFSSRDEPKHISLSDWADFIVVAPASANTIAKCALGLADNLLNCLILGFQKKIFLCPAMHSRMWESPLTRKNIKCLEEVGFIFIGPDKGDLACGDRGVGRMASPSDIIKKIIKSDPDPA